MNQHYVGNYDDSFRLYTEALTLVNQFNPDKKSFYLDHLGMACLSLGEYDKALDYHSQALKFIQNKDDIMFLYHQTQVVKVYFEKNDVNRCCEELIRFLELNKDHLDEYSEIYDFGWIYLLVGKLFSQDQSIEHELVKKLENLLSIPHNNSEKYFKKSLEFAEKSPFSKELLITCKIEYAKFLLKINSKEDLAYTLIDQANIDATKRQYRPLIENIDRLRLNIRF